MKKFFGLLLLSTMALYSCGDDDDNGTVDENQIVGTWDLDDADLDLEIALDNMGSTITTTSNSSLVTSNIKITFNEDGTYSSVGNATFLNRTPGLPDEEFTTQSDTSSGTYTVTGDTIVFSGDGLIDVGGASGSDIDLLYSISSLTDSQFIIDVEGESVADFLGVPANLEIDGFFKLTK